MNKLMNSKLNSQAFRDFCDNVDNTMNFVEQFEKHASNATLTIIIDYWKNNIPVNTHAVKAAMFVLNYRGIKF